MGMVDEKSLHRKKHKGCKMTRKRQGKNKHETRMTEGPEKEKTRRSDPGTDQGRIREG